MYERLAAWDLTTYGKRCKVKVGSSDEETDVRRGVISLSSSFCWSQFFFQHSKCDRFYYVDGRKGKNITLAFLVLQQIFFLLRLLLLHVFSKWEGGCEMQEGEDT